MDYKPLETEEELARMYKYKPLPPMLSLLYRDIYIENIPSGFKIDGDHQVISTKTGVPICNGYSRIVVGDYGAFIEFSEEQANVSAFRLKPDQEYRLNDERYSKNIKYIWLTTKDDSNVKIYYQKKTVPYADYVPNMFYVSPYQCVVTKERFMDKASLNEQIQNADNKIYFYLGTKTENYIGEK